MFKPSAVAGTQLFCAWVNLTDENNGNDNDYDNGNHDDNARVERYDNDKIETKNMDMIIVVDGIRKVIIMFDENGVRMGVITVSVVIM